MRSNARRGLEWNRQGLGGDGLEDATVQRARKIASGASLTPDHVRRMHSFFERHANGRSETSGPSEVTPWDVAWALWGGSAGRRWAAARVAELD